MKRPSKITHLDHARLLAFCYLLLKYPERKRREVPESWHVVNECIGEGP
jgi:hypothetical protein